MSDLAIGGAGQDGGTFRLRTVILLLAVGIIGFVGLLLSNAYQSPSRSSNGATAHALSNGATGYSGIIQLARAMGKDVRVIRDDSELGSTGLVVLTPPLASTPLTDVLARRGDLPTLVILPKWSTSPLRPAGRPGWVMRWGLIDRKEPEGVLAPNNKFAVTRARSGGQPLRSAGWITEDFGFEAPRPLQTISGANLKPLLTDEQGNVVLGEIGDKSFYVLADPDILSNMGMREESQARAALELLDTLNQDGQRDWAFDVTLAGLGKAKSPLRLAFDPPFLAMTLAIVVVMLLAGWQAFARFGPPAHRPRAIAFGKAALVDNAAALIRKAGRQARLGGRYVEAIRERATIAFGVPSRLRGAAIDAYLDKLSGRARFTELAQAVGDADDKASLVAAARALHDWQKEKGK
ncbi:MAG: DUF4350 domain-containing protein [Sphingomonas sp.]|uniref:DUF4350 domain-containing protein n=1 Tax=Sphingomonas sp. TaxID=28214 RepID=UPI003F7EC08A